MQKNAEKEFNRKNQKLLGDCQVLQASNTASCNRDDEMPCFTASILLQRVPQGLRHKAP